MDRLTGNQAERLANYYHIKVKGGSDVTYHRGLNELRWHVATTDAALMQEAMERYLRHCQTNEVPSKFRLGLARFASEAFRHYYGPEYKEAPRKPAEPVSGPSGGQAESGPKLSPEELQRRAVWAKSLYRGRDVADCDIDIAKEMP